MSEEKDKKDIDKNKSEPDKSAASNEEENSKAPPKGKSTEEKLKEAEEKLLRSLAEIENQRRRFEKEIKDAFEFGSFNFAKENLATLDNLQRAREAIKNDEKLKNSKDLDRFLENINIIEKDLISIFERNRIKKIDTKDKKFDPNFHQAMYEIEDDKAEAGSIIHEIQAGYMLGERLLRPALVSVAKKKDKKDPENKDKKEQK